MNPAEVDRWRPGQIDDVFDDCTGQQAACAQVSDSLHNTQAMESWGGSAADAARAAADKHRVDLDHHGAEIEQVKSAISRARAEVVSVKQALSRARAEISQHHFMLDDATGKVSLNSIQQWMVTETTVRSAERMAEESALIAARDHAQRSVDEAMTQAGVADRDLAVAIQAATGEVPFPDPSTRPEYVTPPAEDELPGEPAEKYHQIAREPNSTKVSQVVPVEVPKGFNDPTLSSDLAKRYARKIEFDPNATGVTGPISQDMLSHSPNRFGAQGKDLPVPARPDTGDLNPKSPRAPGEPKSLDFSVERVAKVRAVSATPTGMHDVQVGDRHYLEIDYEYKYEATQVDTYALNKIGITPNINALWKAVDQRDVQYLADRGVRIPTPGR